MSTVNEVQCPVCYRVIRVDRMKRHWTQSPKHTAVRPYPPPIEATRRISALAPDVDELDPEPTAGIMGDDEGGFGESEPAFEPVGDLPEADNDGDMEDTEDPNVEQTFGEGAGIPLVLNDLN
jgi:hypothetical protein